MIVLAMCFSGISHRSLVAVVDELGLNPDDCRTEMQIIYLEQKEPKDDEDSQLIETAIVFINGEYDKGKYNGREAVGFFRTLFGRIDGLLDQFDEIY